jgi:hypothetical protein
MKTPPLSSTLRTLAGHLIIETEDQKNNLEILDRSLAKSSLSEELSSLKSSNFKFERSDLFFTDKVSTARSKALDNLADKKEKDKKDPLFKVFVREVPLREQLLYGSIPKWAAGAKVDHTVGSFINKDGRQFWFDFFPIEKLISLYIQGVNDPVLLFNIKQGKEATKITERSLVASRGKTYNLSPGTIWINSKYLAQNAPSGGYTGLTISGGKVKLNNVPQVVGGKLTVAANTIISVELTLKQPDVSGPATGTSYGADAKNMQVELPETFKFSFSSTTRSIQEVGEAQWQLFGQPMRFSWNANGAVTYNAGLQRILVPMTSSQPGVDVEVSESPFNNVGNGAQINASSWALEVAVIDISQPLEASGVGSLIVSCQDGMHCRWQGLTGGVYNLSAPYIVAVPGQFMLADLATANPHITQHLELWKDELNPFGSTVDLAFNPPAPFYYISNANGTELLMTFTNADFSIDRPVKVNGEPPEVFSQNSLLLIAANDQNRLIYLFDDNLIQDDANLNNQDPIIPKRMALAIKNALFKVTQANGCLLFGSLSEDFMKVDQGFLFLTFGLYAYIPTLPDPYAANLGILQRQIRGIRGASFDTLEAALARSITAWLVCRVYWEAEAEENDIDEVEVSFHFAPLNNQFGGISFEVDDDEDQEGSVAAADNVATESLTASENVTLSDPVVSRLNRNFTSLESARLESAVLSDVSDTPAVARASTGSAPLPDYESSWDKMGERYQRNLFALLDVSTNADLYGISFNLFTQREGFVTTHRAVNATAGQFPIQVQGMDVVSRGVNVKAFTVPQISWEPALNLTEPQVTGDPHQGPNYYPNDGGPMQILNNSEEDVTLAPIPYNQFLADNMEQNDDFAALSFFTLPFGMKAVALLRKKYDSGNGNTRRGGILKLTSEEFEELKAAVQMSLVGGEAQAKAESDMFEGRTVQLVNVLNLDGNPPQFPKSTLGQNVTKIFNNEFFMPPGGITIPRGVPLERIDLSGYGASAFSNWLNPKAAIAETSQAKFDIFVGRCAHEVIQVTSIMYPWAIKVVRTITLFRVGSGYVYRFDTGWKAESDGVFNFRYFTKEDDGTGKFDSIPQFADFNIHPGIIKGLYNVKDIIETEEIEDFISQVEPEFLLNEATGEATENVGGVLKDVELQPVYFNADIEIENPTAGFHIKKFKITNEQGEVIDEIDRKVVPSKKILGFVQIAPRGVPITSEVLRDLVIKHGTIGAAIDCEVNLANSSQKMRLNRFDFNNSFAQDGVSPTFAVAGRGNVLLPKDGSWSMVKHERGTGNVSPVPTNLSVPVIRKGKVYLDEDEVKIDEDPKDVLLRIANPTELERQPTDDTLNYGFLQSMDTQKALFLTPSFELDQKRLFSKTPPLFVDTMRIVNSSAVFPNIGDAETDLGDAISLIQNFNEFNPGSLLDEGQQVWELMNVVDEINNIKDQGYQLLKQIPAEIPFTIPDASFDLINLGDGNFRIYIEYKDKDSNQGNIDFNIDSLANNIADTWKSKMSNIGLVIDLAGIDRLMTIRGKWDSKKGAEASYPQPELEFSDELQPVIDILQILQQLQGGDYAGAVANGLKLAMSNKAGTWEYKFEASKEIPVLRFPVPDAVYNDPNTPFKLEAGLTIGAYFNAAIKVTTDANELLPSAGGLLGFYGRLSVMCVSLSAATVYAIGQVNLDIAADTKIGPSLRMKFGFGAQIVIGLPVAGNVSVSFVTGVEIFAAAGQLDVTAFLLFEGHAEILGGLVSITITIEAKGTISRKELSSGDGQTDIACQVTFGLDISIFLVINISFSTSWQEQRQIA